MLASDFYASPTASDAGSCARDSPCPFSKALASARAGDNVMLLGGTYSLGATVVMGSTFLRAVPGTGDVLLSGDEMLLHFSCSNCGIDGIKFTNRSTTAVKAAGDGPVFVSNCIFEGNTITAQAAGVVAVFTSTYFSNNLFRQNVLTSGETVAAAAGAALSIRPSCRKGSFEVIITGGEFSGTRKTRKLPFFALLPGKLTSFVGRKSSSVANGHTKYFWRRCVVSGAAMLNSNWEPVAFFDRR